MSSWREKKGSTVADSLAPCLWRTHLTSPPNTSLTTLSLNPIWTHQNHHGYSNIPIPILHSITYTHCLLESTKCQLSCKNFTMNGFNIPQIHSTKPDTSSLYGLTNIIYHILSLIVIVTSKLLREDKCLPAGQRSKVVAMAATFAHTSCEVEACIFRQQGTDCVL